VLDSSQDVFFVLDVIDLLQLDNLFFMQHFERISLAIKDGQIHLSEGSCSNDSDKLVVTYGPV
jgi:hypothetical protein